ncbi:MAG: hypothetical protein CMK07_02865 [Ponticaulis sp.]|nr:hypothetical protein [Ponticaulis sp.]
MVNFYLSADDFIFGKVWQLALSHMKSHAFSLTSLISVMRRSSGREASEYVWMFQKSAGDYAGRFYL